jgi:hypothetical protein
VKNQLPQASWFFIAGLSPAMKKDRASLCELCASAVNCIFTDFLLLLNKN